MGAVARMGPVSREPDAFAVVAEVVAVAAVLELLVRLALAPTCGSGYSATLRVKHGDFNLRLLTYADFCQSRWKKIITYNDS